MRTLRRLIVGLRALVMRRRHDADLDDELGAYVSAVADAKVAAGMGRAAAERSARAELGSRTAVRDFVHDIGWEARVDRLWCDLRRAGRGLRARRWRGVFVVVLLGVALAANTVVFSATDSFVLHRLPYPNASRLIELGEQSPFAGLGWQSSILPETVPVWRGFTDLFSGFYGYQTPTGLSYVATGEGPRFITCATVEPGLLDVLGARPVAGRLFVSDDGRASAPPVALIAEELAREEFGSAQLALGKTVAIGNLSPTIVGVLPAAFRFPSGSERIWTPLDVAALAPNRSVSTVAIAAPGRSVEAVVGAVRDRGPAVIGHASPPWNTIKRETRARPIGAGLVDSQLRRLFILLCAAAGCLLIVACANVANLELTGALARARLQAIEMALGASRGSLVRTALLEGMAGVAAATSLAVVLAFTVTTWMGRHLPAKMTSALVNGLDVDARALWFMTAIAAGVWVLTSLPVALGAARADVLDTLKLDARTLSGSRQSTRVRHILTSAEMAVTVLVLIGGSLAVRSYNALLAIPKGFDTTGLVSVDVRLRPGDGSTPQGLNETLLKQIRAREDVISASFVGTSPPATAGSGGGTLIVDGRPDPLGQVQLGPYDADEDFFAKTMRLPIRAGRDFRSDDPPNAVVVDELFAKRFWPAGDAVGARFRTGSGWPGILENGGYYDVVGVAAHIRTSRDALTSASDQFFPIYRRPVPLNPFSILSYAVRLKDAGGADNLAAMIRALAPTAILRVQTLEGRYGEAFANEGLAASIMSAFGGFAFVVAMVGIYGVMAFFVAARTREIAVRLAVGADQAAIVRMVVASSVRVIAIGVGAGTAGAFAAAQWAGSLLFGVAPADPWTYAGVAVAVVVTGLVATWLPARQAARIDPVIALRAE